MTTTSRGRLALCIPARAATRHLPRLFDSVRAQTRPFDEVLLYDDASDDATGQMAREFGATVVRSEVNTGPSEGKNVLARLTTCEWVHFHDADEALYERFVETAHGWMGQQDVDVVLLGTEDRDDETAEYLGERRWSDQALRDDAVKYCLVTNVTNCGVYRRSAFLSAGGFDTRPDVKYNEDQAMHVSLALAGLRFRADDYIGTVVYRRTGSMSSGHPIECARAQWHVLDHAASRTDRKYGREIGARMWRLAAVFAGFHDWAYVDRCVELSQRLGYRDPVGEQFVFRCLARVSPRRAIALREQYVRWFKPQLRVGVPTV